MNRQAAKRLLEEQVDWKLNGPNSYLELKKQEQRQWKSDKKRRAKDKLALKKAFKEANNDD